LADYLGEVLGETWVTIFGVFCLWYLMIFILNGAPFAYPSWIYIYIYGDRGFGWLPRWGPRRNFTRVVRAFLARKILCWLYMDFLGKPLRKFGVCNWWWNGGLENEFSPHSNGFTKPLESSHFGQSNRTHIICFYMVAP
jgi:hypothetical protein